MPSMFCLTKSGAKRHELKYTRTTPNVGPRWCFFQGTEQCVFECILLTLRAACRKHFGEALETHGPLLWLQYYLLQLTAPPPLPQKPFPSLEADSCGSSRVTGQPASVKKETHVIIRMKSMRFFFDLEHFGLRLQAWRIQMWPQISWYLHIKLNPILWETRQGWREDSPSTQVISCLPWLVSEMQ